MSGLSFPFSLPLSNLAVGDGKEPTLIWSFISSAYALRPVVRCTDVIGRMKSSGRPLLLHFFRVRTPNRYLTTGEPVLFHFPVLFVDCDR
jgi:hypothetical protein